MPTSRIYYSTDGSAPTLNNAAGSLVTLLDAILVNGYGAKSSLGWAKTYSGTNQAAYTQGSGSNGFKLAVDDTTSGYAKVRGYEAMTNVTTGTNPFPTIAQQAAATYCWHKSSSATVRPWVAWGNERCINLAIDTTGVVGSDGMILYQFGDVFSEAATDPYCTLMRGSIATTVTITDGAAGWQKDGLGLTTSNGYIARLQSGSGTALPAGFGGDNYKGDISVFGAAYGSVPITYPNPRNGGAYLSPIFVHTANDLVGRLMGTWEICHNKPFAHLDTFDGVGALAGKSFVAINARSGPTAGQIAVETSNTWS